MLRRYFGVVAEEVAAANRVIRLRSRFSPYSPVESDELVRVEGDLRVDKDARLFGGSLDFRDLSGASTGPGGADVPLTIRRAVDPTRGSVSMQLAIGTA